MEHGPDFNCKQIWDTFSAQEVCKDIIEVFFKSLIKLGLNNDQVSINKETRSRLGPSFTDFHTKKH